jgi:hypothetical protein
MAVDGQTPGEAPQPLTLNLPVSNPGRVSGRGSLFSGYGRGLFADHQIVAVDHLGPAAEAQY